MSVLSTRQREVVALVAAGYTNPAIARLLGVCVGSVKKALEVARRKLGATNRWHAVVLAVETGELR